MNYEISSGNGPAECELAVSKFAEYLIKHYDAESSKHSAGYNKDTYRSVSISTVQDLSEFVGSVLWVCKSPYRPEHKRKNWFIDFKQINYAQTVAFDPDKVVFSTFHSGSNGGQNVNKVETGVRALYLPTGDVTVCTDERSQYANKKKALARLEEAVKRKNLEKAKENDNVMRISHTNLERGNAVAKFEGEHFKRIY